jgi:hypothetical protein
VATQIPTEVFRSLTQPARRGAPSFKKAQPFQAV